MIKKILLLSCSLFLILGANPVFAAGDSKLSSITSEQSINAYNQAYTRITLEFKNKDGDFTVPEYKLLGKNISFIFENTKLKAKKNINFKNGNITGVNSEKIDGAVKVTLRTKMYPDSSQIKISSRTDKAKQRNYLYIDVYDKPIESSAVYGNLKGKIVTVDPGHGGSDSGAIGPSGVMEKDITLAISKQLEKILKASGAKVFMTRDNDIDVYGPDASARNELMARSKVGNDNHADVFISIHCNSFTTPKPKGTSTYYFSAAGGELARDIHDEIVQETGLTDRGINKANFFVLKNTYMPAVLVETAFISNPEEETLLKDDAFQAKIAKAIAKGLSDYFKY